MIKLRTLLREIEINNKIYYHGTDKTFDKFQYTNDIGSKGAMLGKGIYLTDNLDYAKTFGKNVLKCKTKATNPLDLTKAKAGLFDDFLPYITKAEDKDNIEYCLNSRSLVTAYKIIRKYVDISLMEKLGYDCVISWADAESGGGIEMAVFNPNDVEVVNDENAWYTKRN